MKKILRTSKDGSRSLIEIASDWIWEIDKAGIFTYVGPKIKDILGHEPEEVVGKTFFDLMPSTEAEQFNKIFQKIIKTRKSFTRLEITNRHKYGRLKILETCGAPIFSENGNLSGYRGINRDITHRKKMERELKISHEQLRNLAARLQTTREEERSEIARNIHDDLGQTLTVIKMELSSLSIQLLNAKNKDSRKNIVKKMELLGKLIDGNIERIRQITEELKPEILDHFGLIEAIKQYIQDFQYRTGIKCEFCLTIGNIRFDKNKTVTIYRILQESLTNVARHSRATDTKIILFKNKKWISLSIKDNGKGITKKQISDKNSLGLIGMRERALIIGGNLIISGHQKRGTTVTLAFPHH